LSQIKELEKEQNMLDQMVTNVTEDIRQMTEKLEKQALERDEAY
jgi:hypothetical protein